jgi:hypothetical protein
MYVRSISAALLAACALAFAACGDAPESSADKDGPTIGKPDEATRQAELKFAQCMREQGIDFPDPQAGGKGLARIGEGTSPEEMRDAEKACEKYRKDIKPPELSEEQQQKFKDAALAHARCMRDHGIDFPDPTFSENGRATIKLGKGDVDPQDPDFKAAEKDCQKIIEDARR